MFFILSKTIGIFAQPLMVVAVLAIAGRLVGNAQWRRRLSLASIGLLIIFTNEFLSKEVIRLCEAPLVPMESLNGKTYEWGIMLTGVTSDHQDLRDRVYINSSPDRVNHSVMLYKKGIIRNILISGGSGRLGGDRYSEAEALHQVFVMMGVSPEHLRIEGESRNTHESAVAVVEMLAGTDPRQCLLITSASHIPRSIGCFRKEGFDCDVFPTDQKTSRRSFSIENLIIPSADALKRWEIFFKEITGRIMYAVVGYT